MSRSTTFATGHRGNIDKSTIGPSAADPEWSCGRSRWSKASRRCRGQGERAGPFGPAHAGRSTAGSASCRGAGRPQTVGFDLRTVRGRRSASDRPAAAGRDFDRRLHIGRRRSGRDGGCRCGRPAGAGRAGRRGEQQTRFIFGRPATAGIRPIHAARANTAACTVPEVLMSGNHPDIARWREEQKLKRTKERRADLLKTT